MRQHPPPPVACGLGYVLWFKLRFREGPLPLPVACGLWSGSCPVAQRKVKRKFVVFVEGSYPPSCGAGLWSGSCRLNQSLD